MSSESKVIGAQPEIPRIEVFRNAEGDITIRQDGDSAGRVEPQFVVLDNSRALLLAISLVDLVRGE